jgi:hypothetical protein
MSDRPILDETEMTKIESRLSTRYGKPIEVDLKRDHGAFYNIERLTLEMKYLTKTELEAIAHSEKCVNALKELLKVVDSFLVDARRMRKEAKK